MTVNQFNYAQLAQQRLRDAMTYKENLRHNLATERNEQGKLAETIRHQQAQEAIDAKKVSEAIRHDVATEALQGQANAITEWYNREKNTTERINATTNRENAATNRKNAETNLLTSTRNYITENKKNTTQVEKNWQEYEVNSYNAETKRREWWTNTVLGATDTAANVVGKLSGTIGSLLKIAL